MGSKQIIQVMKMTKAERLNVNRSVLTCAWSPVEEFDQGIKEFHIHAVIIGMYDHRHQGRQHLGCLQQYFLSNIGVAGSETNDA